MISSSAPPPFRAKQKPPVKPMTARPPGNPMQGNQTPMMRSQNTMGGKTPNMMPPARNTSFMANGGQAPLQNRRMFADGGDSGLGAPTPLGMDPSAPAGPPPPVATDPNAGGGAGQMPMIKPESVNYHDEAHACSSCQYMGQDSQCSVLQMQVSPEGGCNAYEGGGGEQEPDADDMPGAQPGEDDNDTGMGTSASYSQR